MSDLVIETKKLTKIYGEQTAVNSVNLHVKQGRIYGLLGRNGAGKTTIMKMILGLTPITSGEVDVLGQNIKGHEKRIYPRIGAIIEAPGFYPNLTGTENLEIFAKLRGTPQPNAVKNALEVVGLPYKDKKLFSKYSLGMKQRLGIANAILHDPELLILDEPTNGLDPIGIAEVRNFIKNLSVERGKTILISSHILSEISLLADDIGIIDHGVLLEESSMEELEKKNRKYIQLQVSDIPKASLILERQFHVTDYAVQDEHTLRLYDTALDMVAIVFAQGQFTFYDRRYIDGAGWFMTAAQSLATFYVLPAVIALLGSYMICREEQDDTLKSLRLIPIDEVKLTLAKMILAFAFSVLIYLLLFAITFLVEAVLHLEALSVGLVLENLKIYFLDGVGIFFAISPIIALVARMKKGYWLALIFAEIYSFAGLFASMSQQLKTVYPMTAVFNISGYYNANMFQVLIGVVILMVCVILSLLILKGLNRKTK